MAAKTKMKGSANGKPELAASPDILTLEEAAAFLRVPAEGLSKDAVGGHIPGHLIAGEWRFSKSAILAWLAEPEKRRRGSKEALLSVFGIWKDDPTVDDMVKDIYERRRSNTVTGA